jgi:hypothetical protein
MVNNDSYICNIKKQLENIEKNSKNYFDSHKNINPEYEKNVDYTIIKTLVDDPDKCKKEIGNYLTFNKIRKELLRIEMANSYPECKINKLEDIKDIFQKDLDRYICVFDNLLEDNKWNYHDTDELTFKCPSNTILFTNTIKIENSENNDLKINLLLLTSYLQKYCSNITVSYKIKEDPQSDFMWIFLIISKNINSYHETEV